MNTWLIIYVIIATLFFLHSCFVLLGIKIFMQALGATDEISWQHKVWMFICVILVAALWPLFIIKRVFS